jgi:putative lipoprotein
VTLSPSRPSTRAVALSLCALFLSLQSLPARAQDDDPWLGHDKMLHFGVSSALGAGGYGGAALLVKPRWQRALIGGALALSVGGAKELWDLAAHGDPSWRDFTWDVAGSAVGVGVGYLIDLTVSYVLARRRRAEPPSRQTLSTCIERIAASGFSGGNSRSCVWSSATRSRLTSAIFISPCEPSR